MAVARMVARLVAVAVVVVVTTVMARSVAVVAAEAAAAAMSGHQWQHVQHPWRGIGLTIMLCLACIAWLS